MATVGGDTTRVGAAPGGGRDNLVGSNMVVVGDVG